MISPTTAFRFVLSHLFVVCMGTYFSNKLEFVTTVRLEVTKILDKLNDLNFEKHLERVKENLGDHIGRIEWSAPFSDFHLNFQFREFPSTQG